MTYADAWRQYEARKADWLAQNPDATPEQIERAFQDNANKLGL